MKTIKPKTSFQISGFSILLFLTISACGLGQDSIQIERMLKTDPFRIVFDEIQIYYEMPYGEFKSIEWKAGLIHPGLLKGPASYFYSTAYHHFGVLGGFGFRWYSKRSSKEKSIRNYQMAFTAKYKFMPKQNYLGGRGGDKSGFYELIIDQNVFVLNFQVTSGKLKAKKGRKTLDEFYYGLGVTISYTHTNYYGCDANTSFCFNSKEPVPKESVPSSEHTAPVNDQGWFIYPTLHLGYKIGWQLKKKNN